MTAERRVGLSPRRSPRPHPASPDALDAGGERTTRGAAEGLTAGGEELVMLCVRVSPMLRRRLKLLAASSGRSIQVIVTDALVAVCRQEDM